MAKKRFPAEYIRVDPPTVRPVERAKLLPHLADVERKWERPDSGVREEQQKKVTKEKHSDLFDLKKACVAEGSCQQGTSAKAEPSLKGHAGQDE